MTEKKFKNTFIHDGIEYSGKGTKDDPYIWQENGRIYIDNRTKWLDVTNDWLIVNDVIRALFVGLPYEALPVSVKKLVTEEMLKRHGMKGQKKEVVEKYKQSLKEGKDIS